MTKPVGAKVIARVVTTAVVIAAGALCFHYFVSPLDVAGWLGSPSARPVAEAPVTGPAPSLAESERKYLWDVEHEAFVLWNVVFPEMSKAIREDDRDKFRDRLDEAVAGRLPKSLPSPNGAGAWQVQSWKPDGDASLVSADRSRIVEQLWEWRGMIPKLSGVQMPLTQLVPERRSEFDGPWTGGAVLRMWGLDGERPIEFELRIGFSMAHKPDQGDGAVAPITGWRVDAARVARSGGFLLRDTAAARGIDPKLLYDNWNFPDQMPRLVTGGLYVADYDDDGSVDLLITDVNGHRLFHGGAAGKFEDVTVESGLAGVVEPSAAPAAFVDLDGDARLDLILGDRMFRNVGAGRFELVTSVGLSLPPDAAGFAVADYDLDGLVDIYISRGSRDPSSTPRRLAWLDDASGPGNIMWHNLGDWKFEDVTAATNTAAGHRSCFAAVWLDADGDGWPDLFVSDEFGSPVLLVNRRGRRFEERLIGGNFGGFCMGVATGDMNNDGRPDLYLANMYSKAGNRILANLDPASFPPDVYARIREFTSGSELYLNGGKLQFEKKGRDAGVAGVGWAYGPCLFDLDNDGWLDIYAPAGFQSISRTEPDG